MRRVSRRFRADARRRAHSTDTWFWITFGERWRMAATATTSARRTTGLAAIGILGRRGIAKVWRSGRIALLTGIGPPGLLGTPVLAQDVDYIYCSRTGGEDYSTFDSYYYSAVFEGDYSYTLGYRNDFHDFLKANQPDHFYRHSYCFYEETRADAEAEMRDSQRTQERKGYRVVGTSWKPDGATGQNNAFTSQPIRDFRLFVPSSPYDAQVCVRDHECEDGDRVRVSVNGNTVLGGEISNSWMCRSVALRAGQHEIELFAVNGTGYKGDCSYLDGNSGELRVSGEDSQTQSWRHRGGKGSKATIVVTVE